MRIHDFSFRGKHVIGSVNPTSRYSGYVQVSVCGTMPKMVKENGGVRFEHVDTKVFKLYYGPQYDLPDDFPTQEQVESAIVALELV